MSINTGLCPSAQVLYDKIMASADDEETQKLYNIAVNHCHTMNHLRNQQPGSGASLIQEAMRKQEEAFAACLRAFGDPVLAESVIKERVNIRGRTPKGPLGLD